jgi:hypothetical protein
MKFSLSVVVLTTLALFFTSPLPSSVDAAPRPGTLKLNAEGQELSFTHDKHVEAIGFFSATIKHMLEDLGDLGNEAAPIPNVKHAHLQALLGYATDLYNTAGAMPVATEEDKKKQFDAATAPNGPVDKFIKAQITTPEIAIEYMNAANYLDSLFLLDGISKYLAAWIELQRKTAEEKHKNTKLAQGQTLEEVAAVDWVKIVNDMFGYVEEVKKEESGTATKKSSSKKSSKKTNTNNST